MYNFSKIFVSLFYIGFFPVASGSFSSLLILIFFYFIKNLLSIYVILILFLFIFLISIILIKKYSQNNQKHDSSEIVIDEFLGLLFVLFFYDFFKFTNDIIMFVLIFVIFRFFDIFKFFPANWIDKNVKNSIGVIMDDIIAGFYTVVILFLINAFI
tara:strand:- start:325 stop:792 length:468 start_codon:yes stop_codon:yes gene_type:complete